VTPPARGGGDAPVESGQTPLEGNPIPYLSLPTDNLFVADIRDGLPEIADDSIDAIITDPPYPGEYLPLWENLGEVAARVLKPNCPLLAMSGQFYLPEMLNLVGKHLTYWWIIALDMRRGASKSFVHARKVNQFWKSIVWFMKGKYAGIGQVDQLNGSEPCGRVLHHWQQSEKPFLDLIRKFTHKGDTILDPFLGSGTVAAVCQYTGRNFVGCDIDPECIDITRKRLKQYQSLGQWLAPGGAGE
jgi:hypothetical protein